MNLGVFVARIIDLLRGSQGGRRLDEELRLHLELLTEELEAQGMSPADARFAAMRQFGGVDRVKMCHREERGLAAFDAIAQDVQFARRVLARDRGFTATAVLVLALGIGVNNMMFTILDAHTLRGLPLDQADRVLHVSTRDERDVDRGLSWPEFDDMRRAARHTHLAAFVSGPAGLADPDRAPERIERAHVTADLFAVLRLAPLMGRTLLPEDDRPGARPVVMVSESLWRRTYGSDPSVLGRVVRLDGAPATIVGVLPDQSGFPGTAAAWLAMAQRADLHQDSRSTRVLRVVGRVRDDVGVDQAVAELIAIGQRESADHPESSRGIRTHVVGINDRLLGRVTDPAWAAFMTAGFLILFISSANVAHLMIGRTLQRAREIAIRTSLGASRPRIFRQLFVESVLLSAAGGALGYVLAAVGVRAFKQGIPEGTLPYWMAYEVDARVVAALLLVSGLTAVVSGSVPAMHASRTDANVTLKAGGPTVTMSRASRRWTGAFLVIQLALSVVMLSNVVLAVRLARTALPSDAALLVDDVITATVSLPARQYPDVAARLGFHQAFANAIASLPGFQASAVTSTLPVRPVPERHLVVPGRESESPLAVRHVAIGPGYFETLGLPVTAGRAFDGRDGTAGHAHVLINEPLATRLFSNRDPLGQRLGFIATDRAAPLEWLSVIGVAPAIRQRGQAEPEPIVYVPFQSVAPAVASIMVRSGVPSEQMIPALREQLRRLDPDLPLFNVATLRGSVEDAQWNGRLSTILISTLTAIAVLLSAAGLFAVISRSVLGRRRELGVRMALGASRREVRWLVAREALTKVTIGSLAGVASAIAWDAVFVPAVRAGTAVPGAHLVDPVVLLVIGAVLAAVALAACAAPIRRAQAVDPVTILRQD